MLRRPPTYQAKVFVPVSSAAIDPYQEEESFLVDDDRLTGWFRYVEAELHRYRSPFVAAEALLSEMRQRSKDLYQPERLYVSTALLVLQACVSHLSKDTAEVVQAAVHELLPCALYTRRAPLTNSASTLSSSPRTLETVMQLTYAGAFRFTLARWHRFRAQLQRLEQHSRVEMKVMDRLVHELDGMWLKMCFYSWRTYCRHLQVRKARLRRRILRATADESAPAFLRQWRRYAHVIALNTKKSRDSILQKQVEALYPLEQEAKSRNDHLSEEIKEKNRLLGDSLERLEETRRRHKALDDLIAETRSSLADHWSTWKECTRLMFDDVCPVPGRTAEAQRTEYVMNITDTAASLSKRARGKTGRMGLRHLAQFLLVKGEVGNTASEGCESGVMRVGTNMGSSSALSTPKARSVRGGQVSAHTGNLHARSLTTRERSGAGPMNQSLTVIPRTASAVSLASTVIEVYSAVASIARPVVSPLHLMDVLHHNEAHLNIALEFLSTMYSGGHCSVFAPATCRAEMMELAPLPSVLRDTSPLASLASLTASEGNEGVGAATEEVKWGALMMQDVTSGMTKVQECADMNERYLLAVRQCMTTSELEVVQSYLEVLYTRWAAAEVPLSQQKLESVWQAMVKPTEMPILNALYPKHGIDSFQELVHYVTSVAEFSGCPIQALVERLDATYPYDPLEELRILRRSEEATEIFREHAPRLVALLDWLKDDSQSSQYRSDHLVTFLRMQVGLKTEEVAEVAEQARREGGDVVDLDDMEWLCLLAALYIDPSPFTSPIEKLTCLLENCASFLQQLVNSAASKKTK